MLKHMRNLLGGALLAIALGIPYLQAADVAISALPAGTTLTGTEAIPAVQSAATVKTTPAAIKTYVETGGTVTASDPVLDLSQTWNGAAEAFTGLKLNVTNTASASTSMLASMAVDGVNQFNVTRDGAIQIRGTTAGVSNYASLSSSSQNLQVWRGTAAVAMFDQGITLASDKYFGIDDGAPAEGGSDVRLYRDAADTFAQRRTTNAQTLRVYGTYTDDSNYERLAILPGAASGWQQIAAQTAGTGTDNIGIALSPAGTGAVSAHVPDSTSTGGNARGASSVDWQTVRSAAAQVASGSWSVISGGNGNTASANYSAVAGGQSNTASAVNAFTAGYWNTASGTYAVCFGGANTASGSYSWIPGGLQATTRGLIGAYAWSAGRRSANGDAQVIGQPVRRTTTDDTPVSLAADGTPTATTIMIVPDGAVMMCTALVVAKPASAITDGVGFDIEGLVYRSGSTTALLSIPNSTVHGSNALALAATFVANDTLEGLEIQVTGAAATTIYWVGELKCVQVL